MRETSEAANGFGKKDHNTSGHRHSRSRDGGSILSLRSAVLSFLTVAAIVGGAKLIESSQGRDEVTPQNYTDHLSGDPDVSFAKVSYPLDKSQEYLRELDGAVRRGQNLVMTNKKTGETIEINTPGELLEQVEIKSDVQAQAVALAVDVDLTTSFGGKHANVKSVGDEFIVDLWQRPYFGSGERPVKVAQVTIDTGEGTIKEKVEPEVVGKIDIGVVD